MKGGEVIYAYTCIFAGNNLNLRARGRRTFDFYAIGALVIVLLVSRTHLTCRRNVLFEWMVRLAKRQSSPSPSSQNQGTLLEDRTVDKK